MSKKQRVFVRGLSSETYDLDHVRQEQLAMERVRDDSIIVDDGSVAHSGTSSKSKVWWRIGPGDDEFLTQTLQVHFVELPPGELQSRPRPPERGGLLHPRRRGLRNP